MSAQVAMWEAPARQLERRLARAKAGELVAFDELMVEFGPLVLRTAFRVLGRQDLAQDAAQEVFLRLHRSLGQFDEARQFTPWLYRMTVNLCRDMQRRTRRESWEPLDAVAGWLSAVQNPEEQMESERRRRLLQQGLSTLGEKERTAVVLRDIEGLATAEVAEILGSSETTVRSQISTGRAKLRKWLGNRLGRTR